MATKNVQNMPEMRNALLGRHLWRPSISTQPSLRIAYPRRQHQRHHRHH